MFDKASGEMSYCRGTQVSWQVICHPLARFFKKDFDFYASFSQKNLRQEELRVVRIIFATRLAAMQETVLS